MDLQQIRIVLAEDHQLLREGLRHILEQVPDFEVIGEAADGNQAIELVKSRRQILGGFPCRELNKAASPK
jgi:DNA-binding NarL/FixJ family response regulator